MNRSISADAVAQTVDLTFADAVVALLRAYGVQVMFGVGGTHTLPILGALERDGGITFVPARTEVGAVNMAIGYARGAAVPGVVLTSTGPGAFNALSGVCDSRWSTIPILHVTTFVDGDRFAANVHETPGQATMLGTPCKASARAATLEQLIRELPSLWATATSTPPGPVTLEIAASAWGDRAHVSVGSAPQPALDPLPPERSLREIADAIDHAARPLLYVGGGGVRDGGSHAVRALAARLGAPILTSAQGKSVATWADPCYVGPWSTEPLVRDLARDADLALVIGSKLSSWATAGWSVPLPDRTFWIDASGSREHPRYPQLISVQGAAARTVEALGARVTPHEPWALERVARLRADVRADAARRAPQEMAFVECFERVLGADALLSLDMAKAAMWFVKYLPCGDRGVHSMSSYLAMGSALPAAIGLQQARRAPVVVVVGDGGLQMSVAELGALAELALPVTVVVFADGAYGLLQDNGRRCVPAGSESLGVDLVNPDFRALASAYGIPSSDCPTPEELAIALGEEPAGPRLLLAEFAFSREW